MILSSYHEKVNCSLYDITEKLLTPGIKQQSLVHL